MNEKLKVTEATIYVTENGDTEAYLHLPDGRSLRAIEWTESTSGDEIRHLHVDIKDGDGYRPINEGDSIDLTDFVRATPKDGTWRWSACQIQGVDMLLHIDPKNSDVIFD